MFVAYLEVLNQLWEFIAYLEVLNKLWEFVAYLEVGVGKAYIAYYFIQSLSAHK